MVSNFFLHVSFNFAFLKDHLEQQQQHFITSQLSLGSVGSKANQGRPAWIWLIDGTEKCNILSVKLWILGSAC